MKFSAYFHDAASEAMNVPWIGGHHADMFWGFLGYKANVPVAALLGILLSN
jgi:hypothetical protein